MKLWLCLILAGPALAGDIAMTVAGLRIMPERWNKASNLAKFEQYARAASAKGAQLAIAPEGFLEGYIANVKANPGTTAEKYRAIAESLDGAPLLRVRTLARQLKMYLGLGFA